MRISAPWRRDDSALRHAIWNEGWERYYPGGPDDPMVRGNRMFGTMLSVIETAPQAVVAVIEGAVMGGGFGLACVADVSLARADAKKK